MASQEIHESFVFMLGKTEVREEFAIAPLGALEPLPNRLLDLVARDTTLMKRRRKILDGAAAANPGAELVR